MSITSIASNTSARVAAGVLGIAMALSLSFGAVIAPVHAQDASTMAALQAQIAALQAQLMAKSGSSTSGAGVCPYTWTRNLTVGANGDDVMKLQQFLNSMSGTMVAASGAGSKGMETKTFGPATKAAVVKYQTMNSIAPAAGFVGALTRASLNSKCTTASPTTGPVTPAAGTGLMVSAAAQPANGLAVPGAARVAFTNFTLTAGNDGDVTVNSVVVQRTGVMTKVVFDGVILLDNMGNIIGTSKTLGSNDQATIGSTMTIPRGTSKTFTVAGNMTTGSNITGHAGEVGGLSVVAINTPAAVSGSLPIVGASHTINGTLSIGTADTTTSSFDPDSAQNKNIGDTGVRFAGVRVTAGSNEDIRVRSIRWYQTGSAGSSDLANVMVNANGTDYPVTVSSDGKYYTASFGSGIVVAKGFAIDVYLKGDIVGSGAAERTIIFNLDKTTDLYVTGEKYGYGISPSTSESTASATTASEFTTATGTSNPWFSGSTITIKAGQATSISKANEVPAQNIALNVQNQPLGGFVTDFKGEAVTVQAINVRVTYSATAATSNLITSATIVDENGKVVAGPVDGSSASGGQQTLPFTDTITFPTGRHVYTIRGKLPSTSGLNGNTVIASTTPSGWTSPKGDVSGNSVDLSSLSAITLNTMTVKGAALAITVASSPAAQSIVAGAQAFTFANYQLDATQSGEDVRFSSIPLQLTIGSGAYTDLTNCKLFDGTTALNTGSNVINPATANSGAETFTFDQSLVVTKGTVKTLALKCDVSSGASSTYKWGITNTTGTVVTGVTSNISVTENVTSSTGNTMTVNTGALTVSTDSSSPSYKIVPGNSTDVVMGAFKFRPTNEDQILKRIGLKLSNTASSSASDLVTVKLYVGATQIGQATFTGANMNATSTNVSGSGEMSYTLPKDVDTVVTVKADIGSIGTNQSAVSGHLIAINVDTNGASGNKNTQSVGAGSGATIDASGSTSVAGVRIFKSVPTFTYSSTGATANAGVNDLLVLSVSADAKGEIQLYKLTFNIATTTATLTSPTFSGPSGNVSSTTNAILDSLSSQNKITVYFDSTSNTADRVIAAGQTKTYTLRGTVALTGNSNTTGAVSVALKADSAFPGVAASAITDVHTNSTSTLQASSSASIIWSPSSTTTAAMGADNDWTNGYGLGGCFATSGLTNDCTARVISK
jgi:hypothetical protein